MSDDVGRQEGHELPPDGRAWPPPVPSGIHLRSRSAAPPAPVARAAPDPVTASTAPVSAATRVAPGPPDPRVAPGAPAPREAAAVGGLVLDPVGYRLRLVRDAAAALSLVIGAVLVLSLVAQPAPAGAVLSATGAPGAEAGDPRRAPGVLLSPAADPGGVSAGAPSDGAGSAAASPAPGGSSAPAAIPAPTEAASSPARPAP